MGSSQGDLERVHRWRVVLLRAIMVRQEYGRRSETPYVVTEFEQDRKIAFRHISGEMDFAIAFVLAPAAEGNSDLVVQIRAQPKGVFRLFTRLVARNLPRPASGLPAGWPPLSRLNDDRRGTWRWLRAGATVGPWERSFGTRRRPLCAGGDLQALLFELEPGRGDFR
jgi:hypothetical protein